MKTSSTLTLCLGLLSGAVLYAAVDSRTPSVTGTIDVERALKALNQWKAGDARAEQTRSEIVGRVDALKQDLVALQEELESFRPGTDAHNAATEKAYEKAGELNAMQEFLELKLESIQVLKLRDCYAAIGEAAKKVSQAQGIDVVVMNDSIIKIEPADLNGTLQQILGRRLIYGNPALDVTDLVITQANNDFGAAPAAPATPPPAAGTTPGK